MSNRSGVIDVLVYHMAEGKGFIMPYVFNLQAVTSMLELLTGQDMTFSYLGVHWVDYWCQIFVEK